VLFITDTSDTQFLIARSNDGWQYRVHSDEGIAGHAFSSGETMNLTEASTSPHFKSDVDGRDGTAPPRVLLASAIRDMQGHIVGVLEAIRGHSTDVEPTAAFGPEEEEMFAYICDQVYSVYSECQTLTLTHAQVGVILERMKLMEQMRLANERVKRMFSILHALHHQGGHQGGLNSTLFTLVHSIPSLVDAQVFESAICSYLLNVYPNCTYIDIHA
jgi:hypothetical protein